MGVDLFARLPLALAGLGVGIRGIPNISIILNVAGNQPRSGIGIGQSTVNKLPTANETLLRPAAIFQGSAKFHRGCCLGANRVYR